MSFEKDGITFKGSEIDRAFSHANLSDTLKQNWADWFKANMEPGEPTAREKAATTPVHPPQEQPNPQPQQSRTPEAAKQPEPPRAVKRYPVVFGVELDGRQFETLKSGGHILLDGMEREDGSGKYSAFVFLNDGQTRVFRCEGNPDWFVQYGSYEMRLRDKRQVEAGFTTRASPKSSASGRGKRQMKAPRAHPHPTIPRPPRKSSLKRPTKRWRSVYGEPILRPKSYRTKARKRDAGCNFESG